MKIRYTDVLNSSVEWTKTILLRPFNVKKWIILTFIAFMAGAIMNNGFNFQIPSSSSKDKKIQAEKVIKTTPAVDKSAPASKIPILLVVVVIFAVVMLGALFIWLSSRFTFVFLENVVKNDASVKIPFRTTKDIGNSLFLFNLTLTVLFFISLGLLFLPFILTLAKTKFSGQDVVMALMQIFSISVPFLILFFISIIIVGFIWLIANDFVVPVMYKDKVSFLMAWGRVRPIILTNKPEILVYYLIKMALGICIGIAAIMIVLLVILALILPVLILAVLIYGIYLIIPPITQWIILIVSIALILPAIFFIFTFTVWCLNLPFAVFMRVFSLKFIGRIEPKYNLFKYS